MQTKAALTECAAQAACPPFEACLRRHRCTLLFRGPDDRDPQFDCFAP